MEDQLAQQYGITDYNKRVLKEASLVLTDKFRGNNDYFDSLRV
jgi:hypothetical protein